MTNPATIHSTVLPSDAEFERMKMDLFERMDSQETIPALELVTPLADSTVVAKQRTRRWMAAMAAAAAAVTVSLLASSLVGPNTATAEAAEILQDAAAAAIVSSDPIVGPGEYLAVKKTEVALGVGTDYAYMDSQQSVLYVPYDRSGTWFESDQWLPAGEIFGNVEHAQDAIDSFWKKPGRGGLRLYKGEAGVFPMYGDEPIALVPDLPDNPDDVLNYFYANRTGQNPADEQVFTDISDLLAGGLVQANDRALLFEALTMVPGVYLSEGVVNLDDRSGVAISRDVSGGAIIDQLIIDPDTGLLIGRRSLQKDADSLLPANTVVYLTSVETSVVSEAPGGPFLAQSIPG
jgi:hypothetical protein